MRRFLVETVIFTVAWTIILLWAKELYTRYYHDGWTWQRIASTFVVLAALEFYHAGMNWSERRYK